MFFPVRFYDLLFLHGALALQVSRTAPADARGTPSPQIFPRALTAPGGFVSSCQNAVLTDTRLCAACGPSATSSCVETNNCFGNINGVLVGTPGASKYKGSCQDIVLTNTSSTVVLDASCSMPDGTHLDTSVNLNQFVSYNSSGLSCLGLNPPPNFSKSCPSFTAGSGTNFCAACSSPNGGQTTSCLDLNDCLGNKNGLIVAPGSGFTGSCSSISTSDTGFITASCRTPSGDPNSNNFNLNYVIGSTDGILSCGAKLGTVLSAASSVSLAPSTSLPPATMMGSSVTTSSTRSSSATGSAQSSNSSPSGSKSTNIGAIVGPIVAVAVLALFALLYCLRRRRRAAREPVRSPNGFDSDSPVLMTQTGRDFDPQTLHSAPGADPSDERGYSPVATGPSAASGSLYTDNPSSAGLHVHGGPTSPSMMSDTFAASTSGRTSSSGGASTTLAVVGAPSSVRMKDQQRKLFAQRDQAGPARPFQHADGGRRLDPDEIHEPDMAMELPPAYADHSQTDR